MHLAQALNCRNPGPHGPCRVCAVCGEIERGVFPDFHFGEKRHKLADVKQALALLAERPVAGRKRVVVLADVPGMTREAQNVLLKTLEEPPVTSVLVLTAGGVDGILPTVVSRCRHVPIAGSTGGEVAARLAAEGHDAQAVAFAGLAAGGDLAAARRLAARDDLHELRRSAVGFIVGILGERRDSPLELTEKHAAQMGSGDAALDWIAAMRGVLRGVIAMRAGDDALLAGVLEGSDLNALEKIPLEDAVAMVEALDSVEHAISRHAVARLSLEAAILEMYEDLSARQ